MVFPASDQLHLEDDFVKLFHAAIASGHLSSRHNVNFGDAWLLNNFRGVDQSIRMADFVRRSGRKTTKLTDLSESGSGPNSPGMEVFVTQFPLLKYAQHTYRSYPWKRKRIGKRNRGCWKTFTPKKMKAASFSQTSIRPVTEKRNLGYNPISVAEESFLSLDSSGDGKI